MNSLQLIDFMRDPTIDENKKVSVIPKNSDTNHKFPSKSPHFYLAEIEASKQQHFYRQINSEEEIHRRDATVHVEIVRIYIYTQDVSKVTHRRERFFYKPSRGRYPK